MVGISRVCSKQHGSYSNKGLAFQNKLWKRAKNERQNKEEEKSRKSDGVCGENETSTRRGRGGTKESTREHKEVGRQEKKREQKLKERE